MSFTVIEGDVTLRKSDGTEIGVAANPLRTDPTGTTAQPVTAASLPLPSGASTETTLAALNALVTTLNGLVTAIRDTAGIKKITDALPAGTNNIGDVDLLTWLGSAAPTVGQKVSANSIPVVLASDQTVTSVEVDDHAAFTLTAGAVVIGNNKSMLCLLNGGSSTKILRIREIYAVNSQTGAVTGVVARLALRRITGFTGGTALTPVSNDTSDTLNVNVTAATGATVSGESASFIQRWYLSTDEWGTGTLDVEALQATFQSHNPIYYRRDVEMRPLTLRPGQGVTIKCETNSTAGSFDLVIAFSQENP